VYTHMKAIEVDVQTGTVRVITTDGAVCFICDLQLGQRLLTAVAAHFTAEKPLDLSFVCDDDNEIVDFRLGLDWDKAQ
jgi:hypothetical protein